MSRKRNAPSPSAGAPTDALALPTITRAEANNLLKRRAVELFHEAKARQQDGIARFEAEYGRSDRIDPALLRELQHLQMRFAATAARQQRHGYGREPKVNRFVKALGEIIVGDLTVHLATDNAQELFGTIEEHEYLGYNGGLGTKGYDPSVLERYRIVEDLRVVTPVVPAASDDDGVCLHEQIEPFEDDPTHGACNACLAEFEMRGDGRPRRPVPEGESPLDDAGDGGAAS